MYQKAYGIIETLAPLHVGATAGEETGNLNLIFRDQFTQTGIIPGSSIRGRLRSEIYMSGDAGKTLADEWYGRPARRKKSNQTEGETELEEETDLRSQDIDFESRIKIEHASIVWIPVFCPGQPIVWVSCPRLLSRYQRIVGDLVKVDNNKSLKDIRLPEPYTSSQDLKGRELKNKQEQKKVGGQEVLFFNFGFLSIERPNKDLSACFPLKKMFSYFDSQTNSQENTNSDTAVKLPALLVEDKDMGMIHDMALYRQSRVALKKGEKVVDDRAFFNMEALPEGTLMVFPIGLKRNDVNGKQLDWKPLNNGLEGDIYLGGLESVGFGHCYMTIMGVK